MTLIAKAKQIQNETTQGANTAQRVGGWMVDACTEIETKATSEEVNNLFASKSTEIDNTLAEKSKEIDEKLEGVLIEQPIEDEKLSICDKNGHAVAEWTKEGVYDTPNLSKNLFKKIREDIGVIDTVEESFSIRDEKGNIVMRITSSGVFDVPFLSKNLLSQIATYLNSSNVTQITPQFYADVLMIPCYGQSLSINTSAGESTFNYTEPLSYNVNLQNDNIQDMCAGTAEMFSILANNLGYELPDNLKIVHCLGGAGGVSISQLSKGSVYYNNVINNIKTTKANCDSLGLSFNVPCFTWTQGEEDMRAGGVASDYGYGNFDPFTYKDRLKQLINDFNVDIKAITGQTNDVLCISYQVASHTSYLRYPRIALQQLELSNEDERMIVAKTMYDNEYVTEDSAYQVHCPAKTYRHMGNMYGIAIWNACILRQKHEALQPIYHSVANNTILLKFNNDTPLVLDTTLVNNLPDNNYGFCIYNINEQNGANGTITKADTLITKVELIDTDKVQLTLNRSPIRGERLTYAINGDYWQNIDGTLSVSTGGEGANNITKSGNMYGSRGCLRDSSTLENNNSVDYTHLYNWCPIFEIKL